MLRQASPGSPENAPFAGPCPPLADVLKLMSIDTFGNDAIVFVQKRKKKTRFPVRGSFSTVLKLEKRVYVCAFLAAWQRYIFEYLCAKPSMHFLYKTRVFLHNRCFCCSS